MGLTISAREDFPANRFVFDGGCVPYFLPSRILERWPLRCSSVAGCGYGLNRRMCAKSPRNVSLYSRHRQGFWNGPSDAWHASRATLRYIAPHAYLSLLLSRPHRTPFCPWQQRSTWILTTSYLRQLRQERVSTRREANVVFIVSSWGGGGVHVFRALLFSASPWCRILVRALEL